MTGRGAPYLIVAPLSTITNWVREFKKFTPVIPVMLYHGTKEERNIKWASLKKVS